MPKHFTATLSPETAVAVQSNTNHCVTSYYFFKYLKGIQVGTNLVPIKVILSGEFAAKMGVEGKVITVKEDGFFCEDGTKDAEIWTINLVLGEAGFKFGIRFKWESTEAKTKMYVN